MLCEIKVKKSQSCVQEARALQSEINQLFYLYVLTQILQSTGVKLGTVEKSKVRTGRGAGVKVPSGPPQLLFVHSWDCKVSG